MKYKFLLHVFPLCLALAGCATSPSSTPVQQIEFVIEVDGRAAPDLGKCERYMWNRPVRKGAREKYQKGIKGDVYENEYVDYGYFGYGYEVLADAVRGVNPQAGIVTYLMEDMHSRIVTRWLSKATPSTCEMIVSNALSEIVILRSFSDPEEYWLPGSKNDAAEWRGLAGIYRDCSYDDFLSAIAFTIRSCAEKYAFPDAPTVRIEPEYTFRRALGMRYHSFFCSYRPVITEAAMRFYAPDGRWFASIRHTKKKGEGAITRPARRELVKLLFSIVREADLRDIKACGRVEYLPESKECKIFWDYCKSAVVQHERSGIR